MPFNLREARREDYTDEEITTHLATQSNFDLKGAVADGYSHREIAEYLSNKDMPSTEDFANAISNTAPSGVIVKELEKSENIKPKQDIIKSLTALDRAQILKFLEGLPTEVADEVRKKSIENMRIRKYGAIKQDHPSLVRAIENIPKNLGEIVNSFSSLIVGVPIIAYQTAKEIISREQEKLDLTAGGRIPTQEEIVETYTRPYYLEERAGELGEALKESYGRFKEDPLLTTGFFAEENPLDILMLGAAGYDLAGLGLRGLGKAAQIQSFMSKARKPLKIGNIAVERNFAKNPLTRMFIQQPFDAAIERYPMLKGAFIKYKGGKLVMDMRNSYEELNFTERVRLHQEVYENIEKLSKQEREIVIAFLEGRLHFRKDLPGDIQGLVDLSKGEKIIKEPEISKGSYRDYLNVLLDEVKQGEVVRIPHEEGGYRRTSTYPDFMKKKGWTGKEVAIALEKEIKSEKLGSRQQEMVDAALSEAKSRWETDFEEWSKLKGGKKLEESKIFAGDLKVGDEVKIPGDKLKVTKIEDDMITLKDGETLKIGEDRFIEGAKLIKGDLPEIPQKPFFQFGGSSSKWGRGTENVNYQRVRDFEAWYRGFQEKIQKGFKLDEKMTADQLEDVIYKPIEIETGLTREAIKQELGDFIPVYVHHYFPWKAKDKLGVHFAETTGKKYKPGMLKKRKGATGYSEDLTEVLPRMASSYVKWKNNQAFLDEFLDTFGLPVNLKKIEVTKEGLKVGDQLYANHKIVAPDGYLRFYKGEIDIWKEVTKRMDDTVDFDEAFIDTLLNAKLEIGEISKDYLSATKNVKVYLVPDEAVRKLETMATPVFGTQERQAIVKLAYDQPIQFWKDSVLAITPRWIKNNVMGDIIFNTFEGVGPLSYARGFTGKYKDVIPDELLRASFANVMKYNPKLGKAEETLIGQYVKALGETKPAKIASAVKDVGYGINTACEQPFVRALYINIARKKAKELLKADGIPISQESILTKMLEIKGSPELTKPLIKKVKETLPVFNLLGDFGRKYTRRAMPFVNWYKFMVKYGATLPERHPFKLVGARGLAALTEEEREEAFRQYFPYMSDTIEKQGGIPKRFDGLWPIGKDPETGEGIFFNARGLNPFETLTDIISLRVFSMMSPIIKLGAERALGIDTFTGQKFDTPSPIEITPEGKVDEIEKTLPPFFTHIARQFPQFQLIEQFVTPAKQYSTGTVFNPKPKLDPVTGEPKYPINSMDKLLNYIGIDRKTIDVEEWLYKHQERLRQKMAETHKNLLFEPDALSPEEHILILQEILLDSEIRQRIENAMRGKKEFQIKRKRKIFKSIITSKE